MKSLLERVETLDSLYRQMQKMESKMRVGQIIDAHKDCVRIMSAIEKSKAHIIRAATEDGEEDGV